MEVTQWKRQLLRAELRALCHRVGQAGSQAALRARVLPGLPLPSCPPSRLLWTFQGAVPELYPPQ